MKNLFKNKFSWHHLVFCLFLLCLSLASMGAGFSPVVNPPVPLSPDSFSKSTPSFAWELPLPLEAPKVRRQSPSWEDSLEAALRGARAIAVSS